MISRTGARRSASKYRRRARRCIRVPPAQWLILWPSGWPSESLSVYGSLLLRGAVAAAQNNTRGAAHELLAEADDAGRRLGKDGNLHWTAFGPTNAKLHRVNIAVILGDAGTAVDVARGIDIGTITVTERKASLLIDTSRAFLQWGKHEKAYLALRAAEQTAPEEVAGRPSVHRLIRELVTTAPRPFAATPSSSPASSGWPDDRQLSQPDAVHHRVRRRSGHRDRHADQSGQRTRLDGFRSSPSPPPAALDFFDALAIEAQTGRPVRSQYRKPGEPRSEKADAIIVAPATYNTGHLRPRRPCRNNRPRRPLSWSSPSSIPPWPAVPHFGAASMPSAPKVSASSSAPAASSRTRRTPAEH